MSVLLDSLASGFDGGGAQRTALEAALREGLPGPRNEAWKYTSLRALERRSFAAPASLPEVDAALLKGIPAPRLVFVNGLHDAALSDLGDHGIGVRLATAHAGVDLGDRTDASGGIFEQLNAALARDGARLRVDAGVQAPLPLHLVFIGVPAASDLAWHLHHTIELDEGACATVVEHHLAGAAHAHLGNTVVRVHLASGARLLHARVQDDSATATSFLHTDAVLETFAQYVRCDLELGGGLTRHALDVRLAGDGARLVASGVLFADGRRHLDTRLGIEHVAQNTACKLLWRGLGAGRGRAVFHGGITIHTGADGSDAVLSNKNLLLSDQAEIDTQPVLEIHADEVTAAHGATVGQIDPTAMFYLRSRGLPEPEARRLLTAAFCREVVTGVEDAALRALLQDRLDRALARLGDVA